MRGQPILRDFGALRQARGDHPPADRALQPAETEDDPQPLFQFGRERAAPQKEKERHQISKADEAAEQPMAPLPPENRLELGQAHAGIEFTILRDGFVSLEGGRPLRLVKRRQCAGDGFPLDDRQPGFGEPRRAADQHHRENQHRHGDQPPSHGAKLGHLRHCGTRRGRHDLNLRLVWRCGLLIVAAIGPEKPSQPLSQHRTRTFPL